MLGRIRAPRTFAQNLRAIQKSPQSNISDDSEDTGLYIFFKALEESQDFKSIDMSENCIFYAILK